MQLELHWDQAAVKPPSDAQHGQGKLLDPRLRDIFISEILLGQPAWALGALHGTCSFLRDLLDSHATSHIWTAATQYQLWNQPRSRCFHWQDQYASPDAHDGSCGMCVQLRLRLQASAVQRLQAPQIRISRYFGWDEWQHKMPLITAESVVWSHCGRWVAIIKNRVPRLSVMELIPLMTVMTRNSEVLEESVTPPKISSAGRAE